MLFWVKSGPLSVPLASSGGNLAILGTGAAPILSNSFNYEEHPGGQLTFGFWLDQGGHIGLDASLFVLDQESINRSITASPGSADVFGRPIVNALTGQEAVSLVASPGQLSGGIVVRSTDQVYGAEFNFIGSLYRGPSMTADMVIGGRYIGLHEDLSVFMRKHRLGPAGIAAFNGQVVAPGGAVSIGDNFETRNDFYGGQVGLRSLYHWNNFFVSLKGTLAVGTDHEVVNIYGSSSLGGLAGPATLPGGLLAVSSNSSLHSHNDFTYVPEGSIKVGYNLTDYISVYAGYTFLYMFDVARPGEQIDRTVNPGFVPTNLAFGSTNTPVRPVGSVQTSDFWMQGLMLGMEIRY